MFDRSGKAIFAHTQTSSLKDNSKSRSAGDTAAEGERLHGACPHVPKPQPPIILEGMRPMAVINLIERRDESHPHLHIFAVPLCTDVNMRMNALCWRCRHLARLPSHRTALVT